MCTWYALDRTDDRIKYVDSIETDTHVYIATERVRPLQGVLRDTDLKGKAKEEWIGWGVKSISVSTPTVVNLTKDRCRLLKFAVSTSRVHQPKFDIHHPINGVASGWIGPLDNKG